MFALWINFRQLDIADIAHGIIDSADNRWKEYMQKKFKLLIVAASALIISFGGLAALDNYKEIQSTQAEIQYLESERQQLHEQREQLEEDNTKKQETLDQKSQQIQDLKNNEEKLKQEIEALKVAKAEREQKRLALLASQKASASSRTSTASFGGNCDSWIASAGISDRSNARELIRRESGCNPYARNSSSGACGVAQELPCGKSGCSIGDGACQVRWMNSYVIGRYGSWSAAAGFHNANNWY